METKKRSSWDFKDHTHTVEIFKSEEGNEIRVDHFRKGTSNMGYIKFVNDPRGLSIFGDFGNWIFCRPFVPSDDGFVSDGYWNEKLKIGSSQDHSVFDSEETAKELKTMIKSGLKDYGYSSSELKEVKNWFKHLLSCVDDELEYTYEAYRGDNPTCLDYDYIPFCKKGSVQLQIIFDAFDEICRRLKESKIQTNEQK